MKNELIKEFIIKGIENDLEKDVEITKDVQNFKVEKLDTLSDKELKEVERKRLEKRLIKKELQKRLLKLDKKATYKLKNKRIIKNNNTNEFIKDLYNTSEKIVNKALKVITYLQDKKWNTKNDALIIDFNINIEDKKDLIQATIENVLKYGYIYNNILYIKKKAFKSNVKEFKILHNYKHYKNINSLLYYIKKRSVNEISSTQKATYKSNDNEIELNDLQAFNEYIKNEISKNDLKETYKKKTQKNLCNNILKILNLSNKEKLIFAYRLQGVEYKTIAKVFNINIKTVGVVVTRINQKIEKIKNELYINYMK